MRNPYKARRLRSAQTLARLYLELIRTTVSDPPVLSREQKAKMRAELGMRTWCDLQRVVVAGYRSPQKRRGAI